MGSDMTPPHAVVVIRGELWEEFTTWAEQQGLELRTVMDIRDGGDGDATPPYLPAPSFYMLRRPRGQ